MFSVIDRASFESASVSMAKTEELRIPSMVLVALLDEPGRGCRRRTQFNAPCSCCHLLPPPREVTFVEGAALAAQHRCPYFECSVHTGQGTQAALHSLVSQVYRSSVGKSDPFRNRRTRERIAHENADEVHRSGSTEVDLKTARQRILAQSGRLARAFACWPQSTLS